ncbi:hypothetical protein M413DRAFT_441412 [Hebeloma cylindrosporum]|uniref:PABS domain-containing protein n=1 Tax=Hebeloma cylindrosporum TaxID=76867 RepID=A0A0C3CQE8_HEBCY|nr:hypothetical protein M413DRAFT_441412 [Hebeloma cylindrosporum h7]
MYNNWRLVLKAIRLISVIVPLSLIIFTHEREMIPLYGSGPTSYLLDKIVFAAAIASAIHPIRVSLSRNLLYSGIALSLAPNATYWIAVWTSRRKDPLFGPALTHTFALGPLVFLLTTFVAEMEDMDLEGKANDSNTERPRIVLRLIRAGVTYLIAFNLKERVWASNSLLYHVSDSFIFLIFAGIFYNLWIASFTYRTQGPKVASELRTQTKDRSLLSEYQVKAAAIFAFTAFWWAIHPKFMNPILPHPLSQVYTHPTYPLQVLSAEQSVTGLITVVEWLPPPDYQVENNQQLHSVRYLRASHSLLGGVWTHDKIQVLDDEQPLMDLAGGPLGDSIYSTFVLQEAVRLVNSTKAGKAGAWMNALVIGLGSGISATSFIRHQISTTIVEIDPAVYKAARTFFGLPDPGPDKVFLEDARAWSSKQRAKIEAGQKKVLFDIVVHDCFSGGGVPQHIFTVEFWDDLKVTMQPEGILVVNFAGILRSRSSRLVINTLEKSFGQCRAFHDVFDGLNDEKYDTEFINVVVFCTQSSAPLTFRQTRRTDWLGSPLRRHVLKTLEAREVDLRSIRDPSEGNRYILTDKNNPLGILQGEQGSHHWQVMREVLPDIHWETY